MSSVVVKNGHLIDPSQKIDAIQDIEIQNGKILKIASFISGEGKTVLNADRCIVSPGFIDLHVHLREPGQEYKETIETGTRAAAAGGFTSVCCMANTDPVNDHPSITHSILDIARRTASVKVYPIGAVTKGLAGKELAEIGLLKEAGCVAFSDDGKTIQNSALLRLAMEYLKGFDLPIVAHCLCPDLMGEGVLNEGSVSSSIGLKGIPHVSEDIIVAREIALSELTGCRLHIAHLSTARGVDLVREAKKRGVLVSAEVTPHHFTLTDEVCATYDPNTKMAPPLRTKKDIEAILEGLTDGTIDVIATDHAPHSISDKEIGFEKAPFGIIGLETSLALSWKLVDQGIISPVRLVELMSVNPARLFRLNGGSLSEGSSADLVIFDPNEEFLYDVSSGYSKSRNSPFNHWKLKGKVKQTVVNGKLVYPFE